jgi:hypothetical protein
VANVVVVMRVGRGQSRFVLIDVDVEVPKRRMPTRLVVVRHLVNVRHEIVHLPEKQGHDHQDLPQKRHHPHYGAKGTLG